MQNPIPKFIKSSIISEKPGYLPEKLKTLTSSNHRKVFLLPTFCTHFLAFFIFANNSRSKQNKKIPDTLLWTLVGDVCKVSVKNIELEGIWSSSKFSIFQTKKTGFS